MAKNKHVTSWPIGEEFKHTLLGIQYPSSCVVVDGRPVWCAIPIPKDAKQNLGILSDLLRSPHPIPPEILHFVADLFDKNTGGDYKVDRLIKTSRGANYTGLSESIEIAEFVAHYIDQKKAEYSHNPKHPKWKGVRKEAIFAAQLHFGAKDKNGKPIKNKEASLSKIEDALTAYKKALKENHLLNIEEIKKNNSK